MLEKGSGPSTVSLAHHPTSGKAHSSFLHLSVIESPGHAVGPATRLEWAWKLFQERLLWAPCPSKWTPSRPQHLLAGPHWLPENGPNMGRQSVNPWALHKCHMEHRGYGEEVEQVNLSKGSDLKVLLPKVPGTLLEVWTTCIGSQTSLWKTQQLSWFSSDSPMHQNPVYLDSILPSPCCPSNTNHLSPWCQTALFATISAILVVLHLLLKETHSKIPSLELRKAQYEWREHTVWALSSLKSIA